MPETVWDLLAFIAISVGHAELWITLVNRVYGLPIPIGTLHRIRGAHDVAVVAFPVLVFWRTGLAGPRAFLLGQWDLLSPLWIAIFALCVFGLLGFIAGVLTWWLRTRHCMWLGERTSIVTLPNSPPR